MSTPPIPEGVSAEAWEAIGAREVSGEWQIPERDAEGHVIGKATRRANGTKSGVKGSKRGLTLRWPLPSFAGTSFDAPVFVVEGASDVAAGFDLGLVAVGRPGASLGGVLLAALLRDLHVCIIGENDDGAGRKGAEALAQQLLDTVRSVRVIYPPAGIKDLRAWLISGATGNEVKGCADDAPLVKRAAAIQGKAVYEPVYVCLSDVPCEQVSWLWRGHLALGKLTLLAGDPGLGKSLIAIDIAARVSSGLPFPNDPVGAGPPAGVILLTAEDGLGDTVRPRLDSAGGNGKLIRCLQGVRKSDGASADQAFDLVQHVDTLERMLQAFPECRLVVIDPISAYLGDTSSHDNADVRSRLAALTSLAVKYRVAVLLVSHLNKVSGGGAVSRVMGSIAFVAAARIALLVAKHPDDPARRVVVPIKSNLGADSGGLGYTVGSKVEGAAVCVNWEPDPVSFTADELVSREPTTGGRPSKRMRASDWLQATLANGPKPAQWLLEEAIKAGFSQRTYERARGEAGVRPIKDGHGGWLLHIPVGQDRQADQDRHTLENGGLASSEAEEPQDESKTAKLLGVASSPPDKAVVGTGGQERAEAAA